MLKNNAFVFLHSSSIEIPQIKEQVYPLVTETTYTDGKALAHISNLVDTIVQNDVANPNGVLNQEFSKLSEIVTSMSLVY